MIYKGYVKMVKGGFSGVWLIHVTSKELIYTYESAYHNEA